MFFVHDDVSLHLAISYPYFRVLNFHFLQEIDEKCAAGLSKEENLF